MALATALHFGGYEFVRNACLALFTSADYGFTSPAAFPLATALVSPFSVLLLWAYSQQLARHGPRITLRRTTGASLLMIGGAAALLQSCQIWHLPKLVRQIVLGGTYLFQNSYQYLLYTQEWSFLSSVLTPSEGSIWFARIAGVSSLTCTLTGSLVAYVTPRIGLYGLMALTCITLTGSLLCQDYAYALAQEHGFEPSPNQGKTTKKDDQPSPQNAKDDHNRLTQAIDLFRRVPTLRALLYETMAFQSLNTILNVAFVSVLKRTITNDWERSAYTGRLFSMINACSALFQFVALPVLIPRTEPAMIWRCMPLLPLVVCLQQTMQADLSLSLLAAAFALAKIMDYSFHSVVVPMVYQPLDFQSRYLGKEIIGVLGSRFGKSGMSLILSGLTTVLGTTVFGVRQVVYLSAVASVAWTSFSWWISWLIPKKDEAQAIVQERTQTTTTTTTKDKAE